MDNLDKYRMTTGAFMSNGTLKYSSGGLSKVQGTLSKKERDKRKAKTKMQKKSRKRNR